MKHFMASSSATTW